MRNSATEQRMKDNVDDLILNFDDYIVKFNGLNLFTGPSVYFHYKTLGRLKDFLHLSKH